MRDVSIYSYAGYTEIVGKQLVNYSFQFHRTVEITGLSCNIFLFGCAIFVDSFFFVLKTALFKSL